MSDLRDELKVTDDDVFGNLRPEIGDLTDCLAAWRAMDLPAARAALVEYFMNRKQPKWLFDWRERTDCITDTYDNVSRGSSRAPSPLADALLDNIVPHKGGRTSLDDLDAIPDSELQHGMPFVVVVERHAWVADLAEAWARTRNERYAEKIVELLHRLRRKWPLRVTMPETNPLYYYYNDAGLPQYHIMAIGKTCRNMLDALYIGVLSSNAFSTDDRFLFLQTLWFYAYQHTLFTGKFPFMNANHHLFEKGMNPFVLGTLLPEFRKFPEMQADGAKIINEHVRHDFMPSGCYMEHSTSYVIATLKLMYFFAWQVAAINGYALMEAESVSVLKRCTKWLLDMTRPDGLIPCIGDGADSESAWMLENAAALCADTGAKALRHLVSAAPIGLPSALRKRFDAYNESLPEPASAVYEDKGWISLRDGWRGPESSHLVMSAVRPPINHCHWDMGHFVLFTRGRSFIGDPASGIYGGHRDLERKGYLLSMESHNVLTLDGDTILPKRIVGSRWPVDPTPCTVAAWHLGRESDFATVYHDGYELQGYPPFRHVREVMFRKHGYWLILDFLREGGPPGWIHTVRRFIHFSSGVKAEARDAFVVATSGEEAITILPAGATDPELDIWKDRILEPERQRCGAEELPDVLQIKNKVDGSSAMAFLIYPHAAGEAPELSLTLHGNALGGRGPVRVEIKTPETTDTWETHTLTDPDGAAERGPGKIVNTLSTPNGPIAMPAEWTERSRFVFKRRGPLKYTGAR